eukprot:g3319.t1
MNENLLLVNDIGLNLIDYLNNIGIEPVCTCNSPVSKDRIEQWEAKNYPYQLPASLKDFLSVTDGFTLNYDRELHGEDISLGRIHINSLDDIVPLLVEREDISDASLCKDLVAFLLDDDPNAGHVALFFVEGHQEPQVWFQDFGCTWYPIAFDFTSFFRVLLTHVGVPGWQYAFTEIGLDPIAKQWLSVLAPVRLLIDTKKDSETAADLENEFK